jgi:hypothetical protein
MRKKVFVFAIIVVAALSGCGAHTDPMGEYEALRAKSDVDGITSLIDDLLHAKDYENAGAVLTAVGKDNTLYKYEYKYDQMQEKFAGRENLVGMEAWSSLYDDAIVWGENARKSIDEQLELMRTYHDLLYKSFADPRTALTHVGDQQYLQLSSAMVGEILSKCGTEPNGKALVYSASSAEEESELIFLGITAALPAALLPSSLAEVEYVVMLRSSTKVVGTYSNNGPARKALLDISVVHCPGGEVLRSFGTIEGEDPPKSITSTAGSSNGATGRAPSGAAKAPVLEEAFAFIASQP